MKKTNTKPTTTTAKPTAATPPPQPPTQDPKTVLDLKQRDANRRLPTGSLLQLLRQLLPHEFGLAEIVGEWVWIQFTQPPTVEVRAGLSQLGFHWNTKRQAWQHPCGKFTGNRPGDPRDKYGSRFAADYIPA